MKTILALSILFCAIALSGFAELTDADFDKIRLIVKDSENSLKEYTKSEIITSEDRMKSHVNDKIEGVKSSISAFKWVIGILMAVIAILIAAIGIPLSLMARQSLKDTEAEKVIEELARDQMQELVKELTSEDRRVIEQLIRDRDEKIETLTREIETLKEQRTVNP